MMRRLRGVVSCCVLAALPLTAARAAPSAGTILQQTMPPPVAPVPPRSVITLPVPRLQHSRAQVKIPIAHIHVVGNTVLPKQVLSRFTRQVTGHTVTLGALDSLAARITARLHRAGYPLAYAYVPAQTIHQGVVTIRIIEPRYDRILLRGHSRLDPAEARRTLGVAPGQRITAGPLSRGLLLLEQTPGLRVAGTLVPGTRPATSSLAVSLHDTPVAYASLGVNNYGAAYTGRATSTLNVGVNDPFGYGSQLAVNGLTTQEGLLHAGGFSALSPNLYDGLRFSVYGSRVSYHLGGRFAPLDESGQANQLGFSLRYPLILRPGTLLQASLGVLHDHFVETTASVGTQDRSHINLLHLAVTGAFADGFGGVTTAGLRISRGQLVLTSADARAADAAGPQAAGGFWVGQLTVARHQRLPARLHLGVNVSGQLASRNLDGSQQFYLGGPGGVMSYPVGEAGGDEGLLVRLRLGHRVPGVPGDLQAAVLAQAGKVWVNRDPYAGATGPDTLFRAGAGLGFTYHWTTHMSASVDYLHTVGPARAVAGPAHGGEIWASLTLSG
ncbi:MAG: hypothetical protein M0Z44_05725 [Gammaproteobacteria bacterium]|nr:hypothetical protein [Gammaproteobacteria bacterium]